MFHEDEHSIWDVTNAVSLQDVVLQCQTCLINRYEDITFGKNTKTNMHGITKR